MIRCAGVRLFEHLLLISFQSSNRLQPYHLYSNVDYQQLPVESVSPFSRTTVACQSGPDVGLVDIARRQSERLRPPRFSPRTHTLTFVEKGILKVNNSIRVAGQCDWQLPNEQFAYGLSTSLYDRNPFTDQVNGTRAERSDVG